ncbi:MAG: hypothetical protein H6765_02335 [Candidatus Peribacteria bacterium]|nr:MAG: hypothetical protein H6765_02335 [Candidatus Peribacteria bacterium]
MPIKFDFNSFVEEEYLISYTKEFSPQKSLSCHIVLGTHKFSDYQKDLIEDFLSQVTDHLAIEEVTVEQFKKNFEKDLQDLNTKL